MSPAAKRLTLAGAAIAVAIAIVECFLRLTSREFDGTRIHDHFYVDSHGVFRMEPHSRGWHRAYGDHPVLVSLNSLGFRGLEPRTTAKPRIAVLGDSIVFDGGVDLRETFLEVAEARLASRYPDIEILNFGTSDVGFEQYVRQVKAGPILPLHPDWLLIGAYLNDSRSSGLMGEDPTPLEAILSRWPIVELRIARLMKRWLLLSRYSHDPEIEQRFFWLPRYERRHWIADENDLKALIGEARYDWGAAWTEEYEDRARRMLHETSEAAAAAGVRIGLIVFPSEPQVSSTVTGSWLDQPQRTLGRLAADFGIPFLDPLPILRAARSEPLFVDQCHLTPTGNRVVGEALARWLSGVLGTPAGVASALPTTQP